MKRTHCQSGRFRGVAVSNRWPHGGVVFLKCGDLWKLVWVRVKTQTSSSWHCP